MSKQTIDKTQGTQSQPINTQDESEENLENNQKSWNRINDSLELLLSEKELLNDLFNNFLPRQEIKLDESGQAKTTTLPPKGWNFSLVMKMIGFALSNPREAWNLIKLANSPKIYSNPDYQKSLLEREKLWSFVKERSDDLNKIGSALNDFGIKEFSEGNILDQKGLDILKLAINDEKTLATLKEIAIATRSTSPDAMKITGNLLNVLATNPHLKQFLKEKGSTLQSYVKDMANNITKTDIVSAMNVTLNNERYVEINTLLKDNQELRDKLADLLSNNFIRPIREADKVISSIITLPEFSSLTTEQKEILTQWSEATLSETKSLVNRYLDLYKIDPKILDHIPTILTKTTEIDQIFQSIQKDDLFVWVDKTLDMLIKEPELRKFIVDNPEFIPNLAKGVIEATPYLKGITEQFGLDNKVLGLLDTLLIKPEIASTIVKSLNNGDYIRLTDTLITALNDKEIPNLAPLLHSQAKEGLFNSLIIGIIEQSQPIDGAPSLREVLGNYGINKDNVLQIASVFPILLDKPKILQEVFDKFKSGQYVEMTTKLLSMVEENPKIKEYFKENQTIFVNVLDKIFTNTPALAKYNLKGDLYEILPSLLNHPKELTEMIELSKSGKYTIIGEKFLDLINQDQDIKKYFQDHGNKFKQIAEKAAGVESYGIRDEIADVLKILMKDEHTAKIKSILDLYQKGEWTNLIKSACMLIENDPEFKKYLEANSENFAKIVDAVIDRSPAIKTYTQNADIGHVASAIIRNPALIREGIEAYESGSKVGYAKVAVKSVLDSKFRNALLQAAKSWMLSGDSGKHDLVNTITDQLSSRETSADGKLMKLSDFVTQSINSLNLESPEQTRLNALLNRNILFDNVTIRGTNANKAKLTNLDIENITFVNSDIRDVSFQGTKFTNVSFNGANFSNIDFSNATIDAASLKSMVDSVKKGHISLDGAIITGDISGIDLSGISLKNANLSGVSAMRDVNLLNSDLTGSSLPQGLLLDTYNLSRAVVDNTVSIKRIIAVQQENVINKAVDKIAEQATALENETFDATNKLLLVNTIKELVNDPVIGQYIAKTLEASPLDIIESRFPNRPEMLSHVLEYRDKTNSIMSDLYNNRHNVDAIKNSVVAGIMADQITEKLFNSGNNRALEGQMIREMMKATIEQFSKENPSVDTTNLLTNQSGQKLIEDISNELRSKSKYTTAGLVTSGIYIPKEAFNEALTNKCKVKINEALGAYKFSEEELEGINKMANQIAQNLFGAGANSNRKPDSELIVQNLKDVFYQIKMDKNGADLSCVLNDASIATMVGSVDKGLFTTTRTGLTELYYNNSNYTKAGYISGGIYLDENNIVNKEFIDNVKSLIHPMTEAIKKLPNPIGPELQKLAHSIHRPINANHEAHENQTNIERISRNRKNSTSINGRT